MDRSWALLLNNAQDLLRGVAAQLPFFLAALLVLTLFYIVAKLSRRLVQGALRRHDPTLARMLAGLVYAGIIALGVLTAFWIAIPTFKFTEIFASLGLTGLILGFALRDLIENFVAGILVLWRRPFRTGDQIRAGAYEGTVVEINFRSTLLQTYDGVKVFIPNGKVFTEPLENLTAYRDRRTTVVLGIAQDASVEHARQVVLDTLRGVDGVLSEPAPVVLFDQVGEYTNNLHVLYWTTPPTRWSELETKSAVTERLYLALRDAGIAFPYPIRTVELAGTVPGNGSHHAETSPVRPARE